MKSIKQHILERLILNKSSNNNEITYDMLLDALKNMKRTGLILSDIWSPDEMPILPELEDEKRVAGWQIVALYCRITEQGDWVISMSLEKTQSSHNCAFTRLTPENLHTVFSDEDLEKIYNKALENGK